MAKDKSFLNPVKAGDELSAADWNAIIAFIKKEIEMSISPLRTTSGNIAVEAHAALTAYNLYSIGPSPTASLDRGRCICKTKAFSYGDSVILSYDRDIGSGKIGFMYPLAVGIPYLLKYTKVGTGTANDPTPGEEWGVLNGESTLKDSGTGFIICSNPDTTNTLVWAQRIHFDAGVIVCTTPVGGIAARSGTTWGSASCTKRKFDSSNVISNYTNGAGATETITVLNGSTGAVTGSVDIQVQREIITGKYLSDWEDCS